jgi:hypothetical protein
MTKLTRSNVANIVAAVCIIIVLVVSVVVIVHYLPQYNGGQNQTQDTSVPNLSMENLQFNDNRSDLNQPFLHITGQIYNSGNGTAKNVTISIYAIQNGNLTAIDTTVNLEPTEANAYQTIDLKFSYTGQAIVAYNSPTLKWTN